MLEKYCDAELLAAMDLVIMAGKKDKLDFLTDQLEQANLVFDDDPSQMNGEILSAALYELAQLLLPFSNAKMH